MSKTIFNDNSNETKNKNTLKKQNEVVKNLFNGNHAADLENAKFPDWDIVPPNQIINPRKK